MSFWQNVESELQFKNISRKELAEKASFAVSGISLGISKNSTPSADVAVRIAKVLGVSVEYLVTGGEERKQTTNKMLYHIISELQNLDDYSLETVLYLSKRLSASLKNRNLINHISTTDEVLSN